MTINWFRVLLWASAMAFSPQLNAQTADKEAEPPTDAPSPESLLKVEAAELSTTDADARAELLEAKITALQAQLDDLKKALPKATPSWKGAPQWEDKATGFSFKVRGRLQYDVGFVEQPYPNDAAYVAANPTQDLGFNSRVRRARLGVEGTLPGNFVYKAEADFANNAVSWADVFLEYKPKGPLSVRVGHFETFQSLEQITSSRHIMFLERAQMNEAFGHGRRLGGAIGYDQGDFLLRAGIFNDSINADLNNDEWLYGARAVWAPKMGNTQIHLGLNYQHREFSQTALNGRYRARPFLATTGTRFVDTNTFAADSDNVYGLEAAAIFGPLHIAGEAQWLEARAFRPGTPFRPTSIPGTTSRLANNPGFSSYYVEAGYWLTGETRGYKKGEWDRTKVKNGFDKGGIGAVGINLRYDHLDLADAVLYAGGVGTTTSRGGKQTGYLASLVWQPIDYVRITAQYGRAEIAGGPAAAAILPTATDPVNERDFGVDTFAMRFAFDF